RRGWPRLCAAVALVPAPAITRHGASSGAGQSLRDLHAASAAPRVGFQQVRHRYIQPARPHAQADHDYIGPFRAHEVEGPPGGGSRADSCRPRSVGTILAVFDQEVPTRGERVRSLLFDYLVIVGWLALLTA